METITVNKVEARFNESKTPALALTPRAMKTLRCVYCHDSVRMGALQVSNCPGCQICFHDECCEMRYGKSQCPTFGCDAILIKPTGQRRQRTQSFEWELDFLTQPWSLKGAVIAGLNVVVALFVTVTLTSLLLLLGLWFLTFRFPLMNLVGVLALLGSFLQAPALFILSSHWLSERTQSLRS